MEKVTVITQTFELIGLIVGMRYPKDAKRIAYCVTVDPDQTASLGTVCCGSALFAKAYLSEHLSRIMRKLAFCICENEDATAQLISAFVLTPEVE